MAPGKTNSSFEKLLSQFFSSSQAISRRNSQIRRWTSWRKKFSKNMWFKRLLRGLWGAFLLRPKQIISSLLVKMRWRIVLSDRSICGWWVDKYILANMVHLYWIQTIIQYLLFHDNYNYYMFLFVIGLFHKLII